MIVFIRKEIILINFSYFPESTGFLENVIEGDQDPSNANELCSEEGIELNQKYSSKSAGRHFLKLVVN